MRKLSFVIFAVVLVAAAFGCESELQRQARKAREEAERIDREFADKLNALLTDGQKVDENDPEAVLSMIDKIEELQKEMISVDPSLQSELLKALRGWSGIYWKLAESKYSEVVKAANRQVGMDEYEAAIAEMSKFPKVFMDRGPFGAWVENYKGDIKAWSRAPRVAHDIIKEAQELVEAKKYEEALAKCDEYFKTKEGKTSSAATRFVFSRHIHIIELIIDEMVAKNEYDKALERTQRYMNLYGGEGGSESHREFLNDKYVEIEKKQAAQK